MLEVCRIPSRWGSFIVWGVILILIGIITLLWPTVVMNIIALIFSALAFLIGLILIIIGIFAARYRVSWWPLLLAGLFFIALGIVSVIAPGFLATVAIVLMAALSILIGLLMIGYGLISFEELATRLFVIILGIVPLLIGVAMILYPGIAAVLVVVLWGIFAVVIGVAMIVQAITLWRVKRTFGCDEEIIDIVPEEIDS
ncbi:MAG TPA: DUF308 domain-containing protein [Methanoregulaceae archaeon]|nr:DUF308 domain-containing protein [Methanoregulaceae archaeon]